MSPPFHIVRFVIEATREIQIPGQQGGMLYALLCKANRLPDSSAAFPDDFMLDAPEQTRTLIRKGDQFAFGGTIVAADSLQARKRLDRIATGLEREGRSGTPRSKGLGGNYRLLAVEDLVAGRPLDERLPMAVDQRHVDAN
ncbi:MAG: hypothetical protein Tsb009_10990 [Planctomycetaceae bacterium]